jgi:lipopolysaccharide/colanic/teichoic acid biosynthesis glycosyltransferase
MRGIEQNSLTADFRQDFSQLFVERKPVYEVVKRVQDTVLSATALILLGPIWLLIALLIRITTPGPAIYKQQNVGRYGRRITIYKFRTMYVNSDDEIHRKTVARFVKGEEIDTVEKNGETVKVYKMTDDPRVTPIGRVLRKFGLDEIPQLVNVLKGELSLVGPRAPLLYEYAHYNERHKRRLEIMPGITGLWQVTARSMVPFEGMVDIDLDYARRRSYWLDLKIILLTPYVLITGKGAY